LSAFAEARKHLEILTNAHPSDSKLYVMYGLSLEAQDEPDLATDAYENAIRMNAYDLEAYERFADMLARRQRPLRAAEVLDRLIEVNPDDARALLVRGRYRFAHGLSELARQDFTAALELDPQNPDVIGQNAIDSQVRGELARARQLWEQLVAV